MPLAGCRCRDSAGADGLLRGPNRAVGDEPIPGADTLRVDGDFVHGFEEVAPYVAPYRQLGILARENDQVVGAGGLEIGQHTRIRRHAGTQVCEDLWSNDACRVQQPPLGEIPEGADVVRGDGGARGVFPTSQ